MTTFDLTLKTELWTLENLTKPESVRTMRIDDLPQSAVDMILLQYNTHADLIEQEDGKYLYSSDTPNTTSIFYLTFTERTS